MQRNCLKHLLTSTGSIQILFLLIHIQDGHISLSGIWKLQIQPYCPYLHNQEQLGKSLKPQIIEV